MAATREAPRGAWMFVYSVAGIVAVLVALSIFQFQRARRNESRWRRAQSSLLRADSSARMIKKLNRSAAAKRSARLSDLSWFTSEARRVDPSLSMNVTPKSSPHRELKNYEKVYAVVKVRQAPYNKILDLLFNLDRRVAAWGLRCSRFNIVAFHDGWRLDADFSAYVYKPQD